MTLRNTSLFVALLFFVFVSNPFAQDKAAPAVATTQQRSMREIVMMPVVYKVPGMDKVNVKTNLKYTNVNDPNLLMDIYRPQGAKASLPAVIFVHGGAGSETTPKDWGIYTSWGRLIAASDMVAVTFTHRLNPQKVTLEDSANDLTSAINYVRSNADSLGVDKDRICLAAYSAGGALLAPVIRDKPAYIRCLVGFYSYMDLQPKENIFATTESADTLKKFSPVTYLAADTENIPPLFIARAGRDQIPAMNESIDHFVREAFAKNIPITVWNHPTGVHGFDNQNDDERSREIIKAAIAFMKLHLGVK